MIVIPAVNYDEAEYNKKYAELDEYRINIPPNPIDLGFAGLADLVSKVQNAKSRVSELYTRSLKLKSDAKVQEMSAKYAYEAKLDVLLESDATVLSAASDRTRIARANKILKVEIERMRETDLIYRLVNAYYQSVGNVFTNLESVNKNLSEQVNIYKRMLPPIDAQPSFSPTPGNNTSGVTVPVTV